MNETKKHSIRVQLDDIDIIALDSIRRTLKTSRTKVIVACIRSAYFGFSYETIERILSQYVDDTDELSPEEKEKAHHLIDTHQVIDNIQPKDTMHKGECACI